MHGVVNAGRVGHQGVLWRPMRGMSCLIGVDVTDEIFLLQWLFVGLVAFSATPSWRPTQLGMACRRFHGEVSPLQSIIHRCLFGGLELLGDLQATSVDMRCVVVGFPDDRSPFLHSCGSAGEGREGRSQVLPSPR